MGKKVNSVEELIQKVPASREFKEEAINDIRIRSLSRLLFALRCKNNMSQKNLAKKIGCSQSKISKIESATNEDLSISDLLKYSKALNLQLEIGFRKSSNKLVDMVKFHALEMKRYLDMLADLAKDDSEIIRGVERFCGESLINIIELLFSSYSKLKIPEKERKLRKKVQVDVSPPPEFLEKLAGRNKESAGHTKK